MGFIFSIFVFSAITQGPMAEAFRVGAGYITGISVGTILYSIIDRKLRFVASLFLMVLNIFGVIVFLFFVKSPIQISQLLIATDMVFIIIICYVCFESVTQEKKLAVNFQVAIDFSTIDGTKFCGANLSGANFSESQLGSTSFTNSLQRTTNIWRSCFTKVKRLDIARTGNTILADPLVRQLLVTGKVIYKDLSNRNFQGANLDFSQLEGVNFKNANLSYASFCNADLKSVIFTEAQAIGTDFSGAVLTGACFESWNIDQAILTGIQCKYYFLREKFSESGSYDRRPHDPDRTYESGDAEKILTEAQNIVEVLLKQCTNAKDLALALERLTTAYPEANFQKLECKDDADFLVTFVVPPSTDKAQVETTLHKAYDEIRMLRGEVKELQTLRAADLKEVAVTALANHHPQQVNLNHNINQNTGDNPMTTQDNQAIATGSGSFINTGNQTITGSKVNLGNVTNTLNQLATQPQTQAIADHLKQLQIAIETDPNLPEPDKADALEQVGVLAEASQNPTKPETETSPAKL
jgi:uncharacterized protein YjbI with pentapeptide repeats